MSPHANFADFGGIRQSPEAKRNGTTSHYRQKTHYLAVVSRRIARLKEKWGKSSQHNVHDIAGARDARPYRANWRSADRCPALRRRLRAIMPPPISNSSNEEGSGTMVKNVGVHTIIDDGFKSNVV